MQRRALRAARLRFLKLNRVKPLPLTLQRLRSNRLAATQRPPSPRLDVHVPLFSEITALEPDLPPYLSRRLFSRRRRPKTRRLRRRYADVPRFVGQATKERPYRRNYLRTLTYQPHSRVPSRAQTLRSFFRRPSTYVRFRYNPRDMRLHRHRHQKRHQTYVQARNADATRFMYQFSARARHRR